MFNDIIKEVQSNNDPNVLPKTRNDLRIVQRDTMFEMSLIGSTGSNMDLFIENDSNVQKKGFSERFKKVLVEMVVWFRKMIGKIKQLFGQKIDKSKEDMATSLKYLRSVNFKTIKVETYSKINTFDIVTSLMSKATNELEAYQINNILDTFMEMGKIKQGVTMIKTYLSKGDFLIDKVKGYVPSLSRYNDKEQHEIKEDLLGVKKIMTGIDVSKFNDILHKAERYKSDLDKINNEYGKLLKEIEFAAVTTDKTNILPVQLQHLFSKLSTAVSGFFNRNVNLITTIIVTIINSINITTKQMVSYARNENMKSFEDLK